MDEENTSWLLRPKFGKSVYYPTDYTRSSTVEFPALAGHTTEGARPQCSLSGELKSMASIVAVSRPIRSTNKTTVLPQPGHHKGMVASSSSSSIGSSEVAVSPEETIGTLTSETVPADDRDSDATEVTPTQVVPEVEETSPTNTLSKKEANGKSVTQKIKKFILPRACVSSPKVRD